MKYSTFLGVALALGVSPMALWAAEEPANSAANGHAYTQGADGTSQPYEARKANTDNQNAYADDQVTPKGLLRASELMNKAVYNNAEEQVGTIYDVVLDTNSGNIKYVAISTGGFLGVGDALHAVPWKALKCETQDGERVAVLNVDSDTLSDAKGFDQENWPNMADRQWQQQNDRQYQSSRRGGGVGVSVNVGGH